MKNIFLSAIVATATLASCSTVSSILQNTFPYTATVLVTAGSSANVQLSNISVAQSINQITDSGANVKDIRVTNATVSVDSNSSMGMFSSVKIYISNGGSNETLVASRESIPDNVGSSLSLDVNSSQKFDKVMKSGNVQAKMVYVLKKSPTSDVSVKTSIGFNSVPVK
ncbi:hypothetical protein [Kaistella jeonii]|uniref:Late embryogenesis abundant protein LEA-2 subgroup domain-containing protein n=1 Tax=Kaistella jeonii TaxID=266749 RepID=A0A0C1D7M1_9FLAO|nr:hypothetical protein [Kaistella jeonii]KIA89890.1 hypothetical protein OA86_04550 [Kaistella jeonii]SFB81690.1 hypothetical protein SAMN05421876_102387 [Kaistella jeonii]VEI96131.1 Uncharacterised protein [Kaistella jeonii]